MRAFQNKSTPPHGTRVSFLAVALHRETSSIVSLLVVMKRRQGVHAKARNEQSSRKTLRTQTWLSQGRLLSATNAGAQAGAADCRGLTHKGRQCPKRRQHPSTSLPIRSARAQGVRGADHQPGGDSTYYFSALARCSSPSFIFWAAMASVAC